MTDENNYPNLDWDYEIKVNRDALTVKYRLSKAKIVTLLKEYDKYQCDWHKPGGPASIFNISAKCRSEAIAKVWAMTKSGYFKWIEYVLGIDREGINGDTLSVNVWPKVFDD